MCPRCGGGRVGPDGVCVHQVLEPASHLGRVRGGDPTGVDDAHLGDDGIGKAGHRIVGSCSVNGLQGHVNRLGLAHRSQVGIAQMVLGKDHPLAGAGEGGLLDASTGDVVAEDAGAMTVLVPSGEDRRHEDSTRGGGVGDAYQIGQSCCLTIQGQTMAIDLLEMLHLDGEQAHRLEDETAGSGHGSHGVTRGGADHLADVLLGDDVSQGAAPMCGDDDTLGVLHRDDGGAVTSHLRSRGVDGRWRPHLRSHAAQQLGKRCRVRGEVFIGALGERLLGHAPPCQSTTCPDYRDAALTPDVKLIFRRAVTYSFLTHP